MAPELYGLVLIGGRSKRMGQDKSLMAFHDQDQRTHHYHLLHKHCAGVYLSCNQDQAETLALPFIVDFDEQGPLSGILSAFHLHPTTAWLVLACDMPFVTDDLISELVCHRDPAKLATCFTHQFPEPLCAIYEPASYPLMNSWMAKGNLSPRDFLQHHDIATIPHASSNAFHNINTPQDVKKFGSQH